MAHWHGAQLAPPQKSQVQTQLKILLCPLPLGLTWGCCCEYCQQQLISWIYFCVYLFLYTYIHTHTHICLLASL
jgi:hypothetical protein